MTFAVNPYPWRPAHNYVYDSGSNTWIPQDSASGGAGATQYTEDAAAAANPVGTVPILVRADTPAATVTTDGDNIAQRGTNFGAAYVTLLDTSGAAVAVAGGTQYTEDAAAAANPVGNMLVLRRRDTLTAAEVTTDGDNIAGNSTSKGELYVKHSDPIVLTTGTAVIGKLTASTPLLANGLTTTVVTVAAAAAVLTSYYIWNPNTSVAYVQIFDISGAVTLGTSVPKWSIGVPPESAANLSGLRLTFANAIKVAATTTVLGLTANSSGLDCNFGSE